ncbi:DUF6268 family outer membrane beta-barrel protein [Calycomorphotria hydatis]|uniref:Uncharacterized protein n=1 Tax=Calycomorphotria hydatis TaxID=2528027 RepID=A0A517TC53_9PLAN|nr:DUF6268 family outer membrane beta-barrel protein [Calycomorphotria hydatis]QDT65949.1 hypothetical protein V22_32130 [Calycomorphotria hydatis]
MFRLPHILAFVAIFGVSAQFAAAQYYAPTAETQSQHSPVTLLPPEYDAVFPHTPNTFETQATAELTQPSQFVTPAGGVTGASPYGRSPAPVPPLAPPPERFSPPANGVTSMSADGTFLSARDLNASYTFISGQIGDFGLDTFDLQGAVFAKCFPKFSITPGFGVSWLEGPQQTDVPAQLYSARLQFAYRDQINRQVGYELAATPSLFSDFNNMSSDAFRLSGRAIAFIGFSLQFRIALGVVYLDRDDVPVLPAVGVIYIPNEWLRYELVFPRPRIIGRLGGTPGHEWWGYVAGEFGGGSWAVERASGADDTMSYRDYRLVLGLEKTWANGWKSQYELGYVFGRDIEYNSGIGDYSPDSSLMFRIAFSK